jgi:DNA topoisomerase-1
MDHQIYITDRGIYKSNNKYYFHKNRIEVVDPKTLSRLNSLVVPPAWVNVWFASNPKCHIQVHGIDAGGKKQYILSQKWIQNAKTEKFNRMKKFIKDIASFKRKIQLPQQPELTRENVIKLLFNLLIDLNIRVGNEIYAEQNKTYGLTTLRQRHLKIKENILLLDFLGKSKINHVITIPREYHDWFYKLKTVSDKNRPLFYYNNYQTISSEELNDYLKRFMGPEYTCKDFRTYSANILFIKSFLKNSRSVINGTSTAVKRCVLRSIDDSARELGHTRSISRKSYISHDLVDYCLGSFSEASRSSPSILLSKVWSS